MCSAGGGAAGRTSANVRATGDRRHDGKRMSNGGGRVHGGEWRAVVLSFVYFFCVLAAYYVVRPVREQLSAAVGSTQLPWFYGATFIVTLALSPVFAALISRWPRRIVVPVVYVVFIRSEERRVGKEGVSTGR